MVNCLIPINNMIPDGARYILNSLNRHGYNSFIVGGCVRDIILNRIPHDFDICTEAHPTNVINVINILNQVEEANELYAYNHGNEYQRMILKYIPTGLQHGTITVMVDDEAYEVTTFRCDGDYSDGRRPDNVFFTRSIEDDLARRDFTMNAIAFNKYKGYIDPYGGKHDIENRIIRCVGNPNERFNEDGLRIMRAIRFAAQLGFTIEEETAKAIHENKHLLKNISRERIQSELFKILMSDFCGNKVLREYADVICECIPEIEPMIGFEQNNPYHAYDVWEHTLHCMNYGITDNGGHEYDDIITRLSVLFHDIGKPYCYFEDENKIGHFYGHASTSASLAEDILRNLKCSNDIINSVCELIAHHDVQFVTTKQSVKRLLNKLGETQLRRLIILRAYDLNGQTNTQERIIKVLDMIKVLNDVLSEAECFKLKDLAINGNDLKEIGIPEGKQIGEILNELLLFVIDGEVLNEKEKLLEMTQILLEVRDSNTEGDY